MNLRKFINCGSKRVGKFFPLILILITVLLTGCATSRIILKPISWIAGSSEVKIPFSVMVNIDPVQKKYGPSIRKFAVDRVNLKVLFKDLIYKGGTFSQAKIIEGNYADFILKARIITIKLKNTLKGFKYIASMEYQLLNREGTSIIDDVFNAEFTSKYTDRFSDEADQESVNQIMNQAFEHISRQIEEAYLQNSVKFSMKPVDKKIWVSVENVLIKALGSEIPDYRIEAIGDLCQGIADQKFEAKPSTIKLLVDRLGDKDIAVRGEAVLALEKLGRNKKIVK